MVLLDEENGSWYASPFAEVWNADQENSVYCSTGFGVGPPVFQGGCKATAFVQEPVSLGVPITITTTVSNGQISFSDSIPDSASELPPFYAGILGLIFDSIFNPHIANYNYVPELAVVGEIADFEAMFTSGQGAISSKLELSNQSSFAPNTVCPVGLTTGISTGETSTGLYWDTPSGSSGTQAEGISFLPDAQACSQTPPTLPPPVATVGNVVASGAAEFYTAGTKTGSSSNQQGVASATSTAQDGASLTVAATGIGSVYVSQYTSDPVGAPSFDSSGQYFDTALSLGNSFSSVMIQDCNLGGGNTLLWFNLQANFGLGAWEPVIGDPGPTYSTGPPPCLSVTLNSSTSPSLSQLTGTVFAVQTPSPTAVEAIAIPKVTVQGRSVLFAAVVKSEYAVPTGTVTFEVGSSELCTATLEFGVGWCASSKAPVGTDSVIAAYSGDATHLASSGTTQLVVYLERMPIGRN